MIQNHINAKQFFCPVAFDLTVYNTFDNVQSKVVNVYMTTCTKTINPLCVSDTTRKQWFDGKQIILLMNSQRIDYNNDKIYQTVNESSLHWLPFLYTMP